MSKYYLNNGDAYRLKLWIDKEVPSAAKAEAGVKETTATC